MSYILSSDEIAATTTVNNSSFGGVNIDIIDLFNQKLEESKGEEEDMETVALKEYKGNVVEKIENYKVYINNKLNEQYRKEINEIEKESEIAKLTEKHLDELVKEIRELFKDERSVKCQCLEKGTIGYRRPIIEVHSYLTDKEHEKAKSVDDTYKQYKDNINVYFNLLTDSINLCNSETQVQEFSMRKGFTDGDGMYVSCKKYSNDYLEEIKNFE